MDEALDLSLDRILNEWMKMNRFLACDGLKIFIIIIKMIIIIIIIYYLHCMYLILRLVKIV